CIHVARATSYRSPIWSKWWWVMKTGLTALSGTPARTSWLTTPRPASNRMFSSPRRTKVVEALRLGSGRGPPVPRRTIFMRRSCWRALFAQGKAGRPDDRAPPIVIGLDELRKLLWRACRHLDIQTLKQVANCRVLERLNQHGIERVDRSRGRLARCEETVPHF